MNVRQLEPLSVCIVMTHLWEQWDPFCFRRYQVNTDKNKMAYVSVIRFEVVPDRVDKTGDTETIETTRREALLPFEVRTRQSTRGCH